MSEASRMDEFDPSEFYAPPQEGAANGPAKAGPDPDLDPGPVLRRWERWRPFYNAILAGITLLTACLDLGKTLQDPAFWAFVGVAAIMANVCYSAGPFAEAYLYWVGIRGRPVGLVLLVLGTLLSAFLAFGSVLVAIDPSLAD